MCKQGVVCVLTACSDKAPWLGNWCMTPPPHSTCCVHTSGGGAASFLPFFLPPFFFFAMVTPQNTIHTTLKPAAPAPRYRSHTVLCVCRSLVQVCCWQNGNQGQYTKYVNYTCFDSYIGFIEFCTILAFVDFHSIKKPRTSPSINSSKRGSKRVCLVLSPTLSSRFCSCCCGCSHGL